MQHTFKQAQRWGYRSWLPGFALKAAVSSWQALVNRSSLQGELISTGKESQSPALRLTNQKFFHSVLHCPPTPTPIMRNLHSMLPFHLCLHPQTRLYVSPAIKSCSDICVLKHEGPGWGQHALWFVFLFYFSLCECLVGNQNTNKTMAETILSESL